MTENEILKLVGTAADNLGYDCYVVGGYVRDKLLGNNNDDFDFVVVGPGIDVANEVCRILGGDTEVNIFPRYGTAQIRSGEVELEFVGARKESYQKNSRKPVVEIGTLQDDLERRDFTVNALAVRVNNNGFGEMVDLFGGRQDLNNKIIKTPGDPRITFSDDPLRMLRCIRFAVKLGFDIDQTTFDSIISNKNRLEIISKERIQAELCKIISSPDPERGFLLLNECGLLNLILPELVALDESGKGHKNNFRHSIKVLGQLSEKSENMWLRWAALLHDIGKAKTAELVEGEWTFYGHEYLGAKMIPKIFKRLGLPEGAEMRYVAKMVELHMRPGLISCNEIKDSAVRRLLFDADPYIDDLILLGESDITSRYQDKHDKLQRHYDRLKEMIEDLKARDAIRLFQPCLDGNMIMSEFNLRPGREVGQIKEMIKNAILDGLVDNERECLIKYIKENYYG